VAFFDELGLELNDLCLFFHLTSLESTI
jgi:hypothetical protein